MKGKKFRKVKISEIEMRIKSITLYFDFWLRSLQKCPTVFYNIKKWSVRTSYILFNLIRIMHKERFYLYRTDSMKSDIIFRIMTLRKEYCGIFIT